MLGFVSLLGIHLVTFGDLVSKRPAGELTVGYSQIPVLLPG